ncbi:MAG: protein kinase [Candidatus Acidiferrales bacterium]
MTTPVDRNKDFPAPTGVASGSERQPQEPAHLSEVPDVATLTLAEPLSPTAADLHLGSAALAALSERYDILGEAGHGAMGSVYKARDRETQQVVALKLIKTEFAADQTMMDRFKNELLFARKITHKAVCRVYEFNRIGGVAYTSMEFVEGESLRSVLNRFGGLPLRKALDLTLQICSGIKEAHAQGIVHRDLKPENVMIDSRGNEKIMDFGIARSMESATRLTGAMMGTPAYMSPEQVSGKPVDYRTDIYSLGLVLYEVFTGQQAFAGENPVAVALKQMQETPVPPHEIEPTIPVSVERAILKCLEKNPDKRFQSIAELERALTSSGIRAILASPRDPAQTLANREAIARLATGTRSLTARTAPVGKRTVPVLWILLGAFIATAVASGVHWAALSRAAKNLPPPSRLAAPAPPEFAWEKQRSEPPGTRPQPAGPVPQFVPKSELETPASRAETVTETPAPAGSVPASGSPAELSQEPPVEPSATPRLPRRASKLEAGGASANSTGFTYLWIGRFQLQDSAQDAARKIEDLGLPTIVVPRRNPNGEFFVLLSGPFGPQKAPDVMQQLESQGFTNIHAIKNLNLPQRSNQ